jgi:hypothetical protein
MRRMHDVILSHDQAIDELGLLADLYTAFADGRSVTPTRAAHGTPDADVLLDSTLCTHKLTKENV